VTEPNILLLANAYALN